MRIVKLAGMGFLILGLAFSCGGAPDPASLSTRSENLASSTLPASTTLPASRTTHYVSKTGSNADGASWATAWNELDEIDWNVVQPGATILLDGGASEAIYSTTLMVGKSGLKDRPITIKLSSEANRDGRVVIDGGLKYWPCQATEPSPYTEQHPAGTRNFGIDVDGQSWITIDGANRSGIEIRNHNQEGITLGGASHVRLANIHIHHNTYAVTPNGSGIDISGDSIMLERLVINNNGQDAIQGGNVTNLVLQDSYLHDHYCSHPDGIQLYYGINQGITIRRNIFHNFLQGIFLGGSTHDASAEDVDVFYNVFYNSTYGIVSNHERNQRWDIYNNTIVDIEEIGIHLFKSSGDMIVRNNILYNSKLLNPQGTQSNNLFYQVPNAPSGNGSIQADPQFVDKAARNYQLRVSSPAIDAGIDVGLTSDFLGTVVPSGAGVDLGAFEVASTTASVRHLIPLIQNGDAMPKRVSSAIPR